MSQTANRLVPGSFQMTSAYPSALKSAAVGMSTQFGAGGP